MAKLIWDATGEHFYQTGTKNGIYFPTLTDTTATDYHLGYGKGVAWNGLTGVTETPSGAEENAQYADDIKYLALRGTEDFGGTIECFAYPDAFKQSNGEVSPVTGMTIGQQSRRAFGFAFKSVKGNEVLGNDYGEMIHIIYNATISPSERAYATINQDPEAITFSYEFTTTPINVSISIEGQTFKKTSLVTIDSTLLSGGVNNAKYKQIWETLEGTSEKDSQILLPHEVYTILSAN